MLLTGQSTAPTVSKAIRYSLDARTRLASGDGWAPDRVREPSNPHHGRHELQLTLHPARQSAQHPPPGQTCL